MLLASDNSGRRRDIQGGGWTALRRPLDDRDGEDVIRIMWCGELDARPGENPVVRER